MCRLMRRAPAIPAFMAGARQTARMTLPARVIRDIRVRIALTESRMRMRIGPSIPTRKLQCSNFSRVTSQMRYGIDSRFSEMRGGAW